MFQYFVDAKRDTTIGNLKFFIKKKYNRFQKKSTKQKDIRFFLAKKTKIFWILLGKRKTKKTKVKKKHYYP